MISPQLSVVMSVFNCQKYLPEAIESILSQTFLDFEFIIINDGATDESPLIIEEYAHHDKRIRFRHLSHMGISKASNVGLQLSRGKFIARMDGDDIALPHRFKLQISYMNSSSDCVALSANVLFIDSDGNPLKITQQEIVHEYIEKELLRGRGLALVHSAVMFRREAIDKIGGYTEYDISEDLDLYLRLAEIGKLSNLPDVLQKIRLHSTSVTASAAVVEDNNRKSEIIRSAMKRRGMNPANIQIPKYRQPQSVGEHHRMLSYMAIEGGQLKTAKKHAFKALGHEMFSLETLKVLCLSIILVIPGIRSFYNRYKKMLPVLDTKKFKSTT